MEGYLKIFNAVEGDAVYKPEMPGLIQLDKISENLTILKIYFQDLATISTEDYSWPEDGAEVMLANYAVKYNSLDDLDGQTITINDGWTENMHFAMLSVWDGEPINNSVITFEKVIDGCFRIFWKGSFGRNKSQYPLELSMLAYQTNDLATPLCDYNEELIAYYNGHV